VPTLVRFGNVLGAAGLAAALLAGFVWQFALGELPCPLCNLQRVAIALCGFGFLLNLRFGPHPLHYGLTLIGALFGLAVAGRQILLHIVPGSGTYGSAVLGLHLYSWAFVLFFAVVAGVAVLLVVAGGASFDPHRSGTRLAAPFSGAARLAAWLLIVMTFANAVASFVQCGPIECSDNPTHYWLLSRLFD
jgi:disulfide bond formation protein DsbB